MGPPPPYLTRRKGTGARWLAQAIDFGRS